MVALAVHNALSAPRHVLMVVVFNPQFIISSQSYQNIAMCSALCAFCVVDAHGCTGDSLFAEYLEHPRLAYGIPPFTSSEDIMACTLGIVGESGAPQNCWVEILQK